MFNSDLTANRPAAGIVGRIFIAIDSPYGIFRDTGTAWDQISSAGGGATIYSGDGTLTGDRVVSSGGFNLTFAPQTTFSSSLTAATGGSSYAVLGSNALTFAAGFSSSNIGNVYSANGAINAQNFLGNATFAQANLASAMVSVNSIDFGSGGHTITMTQSTGIRAMTGHQSQIQFQGSHNGTISHAAISQNLGFYRPPSSTRTLTITNAYSLLLNALDDYGAGFTFTNRWGIYQAGASDVNYFAANTLFGTTINAGYRVDINGITRITGSLIAVSNGNGTAAINLPQWNSTTNGFDFLMNDDGILRFRRIASNVPTDMITFDRVSSTITFSNLFTFIAPNIISNSSSTTVRYRLRNLADVFVGWDQGDETAKLAVQNDGVTRYVSLGGSSSSGTVFTPVLTAKINNASIGIGTKDPNITSILEIVSTTKGFLPPRMTNAQRTAITSPAVGLIVYCTDAVEGLYVNKSTGWTFVI
jgi:hypothetical protein